MTILDIIKFPNKALTEKAKNIKNITNGTITCIKNMITTMYFFKGIGLASTQVNIKKKIIIVNTTEKEKPIILINPKITEFSKKNIITKEGCLSFPDIFINIKRSENIKLYFIDIHNRNHNIHINNLLSICIQHEIDHLNGITIYNKISKLKKYIFFDKKK